MAWRVEDRAGTAAIVFSDTDEVLLKGIQAGQVNAGWFVP